MNQLSSRDIEQISAYLDGQLSRADAARLESRIQSDPEARSVYEGLRQSRAVLRQLPARRAPRNFRLTPKMVGIKPPLPRVFPVFRLASALAAILFFLGYAFNLSAPLAASMGASATFAYDANNAPAATEAPQVIAPKFAPSQAAGLAPQDTTAAATATSEEATSLSATELTEQTEIAPQPNARSDPYAATLAVPQPPALPIHPFWLFGLLGLAVVSGAGAFVVRIRTEQKWRKANAAGPVRLGRRDLFLIVLAVVVVLLLAAAVYWMSTGFSAAVGQTLDSEGNPSVVQAQEIPVLMGNSYNFSFPDSQGLVTIIDFPMNALQEASVLHFIYGLDVAAPENMASFPDHAFSLFFPPGVKLQAPFTVRMNYGEDVSSVGDENKLALYWWSGAEWLDAATTCTPASQYSRLPDKNQISIRICHLGTFLLVAP
jgi:hypothetical protein